MRDAPGSADERTAWRCTGVCRLLLIFLAVGGAVCGLTPGASAAPRVALSWDHNDGWSPGDFRIGNGKFIKNAVSVNSPTFNRGIQHVSNANAGGKNPAQSNVCKHGFHHCRVVQKIIDP